MVKMSDERDGVESQGVGELEEGEVCGVEGSLIGGKRKKRGREEVGDEVHCCEGEGFEFGEKESWFVGRRELKSVRPTKRVAVPS